MHFAKNRIARIFVPYLPISIALVLAYSLLPELSAADRDWSLLASFTLIPTESNPALNVAWTLQHELVFYLLFAVAFFSGNLLMGCVIWAAAILAGLAFGFGDDLPLRILMNPINLEFFFGILCAILSSRTPRGFLLYLMGAGICILLFFALGGQRGYSVLFGLGVAFLIVPIIQLEYAGRLRAAPWLVFLGNASYSIYLIHNPVVSITSRIAAAVPLLNGWLAAILFSFAISIGCGCIYHLLVERPGLAITRRLMFRKNSQRGEFTLENS